MKPLIDILDEMNLREDKVKENLIEKIERLANLIFDIDGQSGNLVFVNTLLEEIIDSRSVDPHLGIPTINIELLGIKF